MRHKTVDVKCYIAVSSYRIFVKTKTYVEILVGRRLLKVIRSDLQQWRNRRPSTLSSWRTSDAGLRSSATSSTWTRTLSTPTNLSTRSTRLSTEQLPAGTSRLTSPTMRTVALGAKRFLASILLTHNQSSYGNINLISISHSFEELYLRISVLLYASCLLKNADFS